MVSDGGLYGLPTLNVLHSMLNKGGACLTGNVLTGISVIAGKDHLRTLPGHTKNSRFANTIGAACYQGDFVV